MHNHFLSDTAALLGRSLRHITRSPDTIITTAIMPIAFMLLFTLALTWIAVIPGLTAKSIDGASAFSYPLIFLPFISSAFVPTRTMPGPVRAFADNQPVTSIVDTIRALFAGQPVGTGVWTALAWCVGILVVAYVVANIVYRRRIS